MTSSVGSNSTHGRKRKAEEDENSILGSSVELSTKTKKVKKTTIIGDHRGYQNRYEPTEQMSKDEVSRWRHEARKQRNRLSAAKSRNKIKDRIKELESEVSMWKNKYELMMRRLRELEREKVALSPVTASSQSTTEDQHHLLTQTISPMVIHPSAPINHSCVSVQEAQHTAQTSPSTPYIHHKDRNTMEHHIIDVTSLQAK